jgi:hypothetical protein
VSATVGLIFKIIYDTVGRNKIGRIIVAILGAGWAVMTFFVIPILVIERRGPFDAIKRSWKIMTKTWGPNLLANFGIGLLVFILLCIAMLPVYLSSFIGGLAVVFGLAITILLVLLVQLIFSCLRVITTAALYQYAISGVPPKGFKGAGLYDAFEARKYNAY